MRRALLAPLVVLLLVVTGCTTNHTARLKCQVTAVSPQGQPPASTPKAALNWFLSHLAQHQDLPLSGYVEEGHNATRIVYRDAKGLYRISVGNFGTKTNPDWAVENTISC